MLDDESPGQWALGGASRWWLHHSLAALDRALRERGSQLILRRGESAVVLAQLVEETGARAIYWSRAYEPWAVRLEQRIHRVLEEAGVRCRRFSGHLLFQPEEIRSGAGYPYKVFTPFANACRAAPAPGAPHAPPHGLQPLPKGIESESLDSWGLTPIKPDWAGGLRETWTPGEDGAHKRLEHFMGKALADYAQLRDKPGVDATSRLSPHLHFGEISPRQCWHRVTRAAGRKRGKQAEGAEGFLRELLWREFSYHLLFNLPRLPETPLRPEFTGFPWREDAEGLRAWQKGRTGYPIVDAGMRELWATGWMHNRVRMVAASFLVKHLLVPWQEGAAWFWDTLVDADLASNSTSWQWVAGCGADAAPYFRIFNPVLQGRKFDPDGAYVRRWVPELAKLPKSHIHAPWKAPARTLSGAEVELGETYPEPIVDHDTARKRALEAYETIKKKG